MSMRRKVEKDDDFQSIYRFKIRRPLRGQLKFLDRWYPRLLSKRENSTVKWRISMRERREEDRKGRRLVVDLLVDKLPLVIASIHGERH